MRKEDRWEEEIDQKLGKVKESKGKKRTDERRR
jgi:uncharacterized protein YjbJ (UPF0337 family)